MLGYYIYMMGHALPQLPVSAWRCKLAWHAVQKMAFCHQVARLHQIDCCCWQEIISLQNIADFPPLGLTVQVQVSLYEPGHG